MGNGFENIDYLLERLIIGPNRFNALVIIDDLDDELEKVLISRFKFPVEILTLERYAGPDGESIFKFEPFLADVSPDLTNPKANGENHPIDPSELDTIVVPAHEDGFEEVFLKENRWYKIRIHSSMIPKIKNIAAYQVSPESAITYIAPVANIEQWPETSKYVVNFSEPAQKIGPLRLVPDGKVRPVQAPRYTSRSRLERARNLDEAFSID